MIKKSLLLAELLINVTVRVNSEFLSSIHIFPRYMLQSAESQYFTGGPNVQDVIIPCEWQLRIQTRPTYLPLFQHFISYNDQLLELIVWKITLYFLEGKQFQQLINISLAH
jgi:hypothetical protein